MNKTQFHIFNMKTLPDFDKTFHWKSNLENAEFVIKTSHFDGSFSQYRESFFDISFNEDGIALFNDKNIISMGTEWPFPIFVLAALHFQLQNDFRLLNHIFITDFRWAEIVRLIVSEPIGLEVLNYVIERKYNILFFEEVKKGIQIFVEQSFIIAPFDSPNFFFTLKPQLERVLSLVSKDFEKINQLSEETLKSKDLGIFLNFITEANISSLTSAEK